MGWFPRKRRVPVEHPRIERVVYVPAVLGEVQAHLERYSSSLRPRHVTDSVVQLAAAGGVVAVRLPPAVHPWQLHNLAYWMLDCGGLHGEVVARCEASPAHTGYTLVRDPELPDCLCGWDDAGEGWTVHVPGNDVVRPEAVPTLAQPLPPGGFTDWWEVPVRFEDPGAQMNPANERTYPSRDAVRKRYGKGILGL